MCSTLKRLEHLGCMIGPQANKVAVQSFSMGVRKVIEQHYFGEINVILTR